MAQTAQALDVPMLTGTRRAAPVAPGYLIVRADTPQALADYRRLRRQAFVEEQGLFRGHDLDHLDEDPRTVVLVARDREETVVGGVRLAPATPDRDLGWWTGSRLVVAPGVRSMAGIGGALVRAACAHAESAGVLRFEATVQARNEVLFRRLGWVRVGTALVAGVEHVHMRWPIDRIQAAVRASKAFLGDLLRPILPGQPVGGPDFTGDDATRLPGTDLVAACDAVLPSLVERDPEWAGWCAVLVNVNDLSAMGAAVIGLFDALGARDASFARRVLAGLRRGSEAWGAPVLGGHTQLGVPASLTVTALGRAAGPVPGGGGRPGHALTVSADLTGGWRPGYRQSQWDSTSGRRGEDLRALAGLVARAAPAAAKDISMAGMAGTAGMLAEASGCGATLEVERIPRPAGATVGDWLTCFPGFAMVTADRPGAGAMASPLLVSRECGELTGTPGVRLLWPDGMLTGVVDGPVTGLGRAQP